MSRRIAAALFFAAALLLFVLFFFRMPVLWDSDSYYHLAVARLYGTEGITAHIPWARFSLLANGGDKELLFHVLLIPFAKWLPPAAGGRIALALLNALIATIVGLLAARAIGGVGFLVPLWLYVAAPPFFARAVRLRPELLALLLILIAIPVAAQRRARLLGFLALLFTLGYTAFHVFLALCFLWAVVDRRPRLFAWPLAGTILGLVARPHPIASLQIWYVQNVAFFFNARRLDVGNEILPPHFETLLISIGWILGVAALIVLGGRAAREHRDELPFAIVPAAVFAILFAGMARMATYAFPLVTVAILFAIGRPQRIAAAIALVIATVISVPAASDPMLVHLLRNAKKITSETEWARFGRAVPAGAKVAADWERGELYAFWAPQGRYLNVLDPIFMALTHPKEYATQRKLFAGTAPDVVAAMGALDSDFIAFDWTDATRPFLERVRSDPRLRVVYGGYNVLMQTRAAPSVAYVDLRAAAHPCAANTLTIDGGRYRFAPYGPSTLAIDGVKQLEIRGALLAILHRGIVFDVPPGTHRIDVRTCLAADDAGFYLVRER